ncbi:MAG: Flp pilus assembly complex ATPase component [Gammaproteobacteria bacterium]|nr:Flp pilus assembly complex ATPase component [Gammaproteobacteria bacterium]
MKGRNAVDSSNDNFARGVDTEIVVKRRGSTVCYYQLNGQRTMIGRSTQADLQIASRYISAKHALVDFNDSGAFIVDLDSKNRTLVNGEATKKSVLRDGDVISIGYYRLYFRETRRRGILRYEDSNGTDTSADELRAVAGSFHEDADMMLADLDTRSPDRDICLTDPGEDSSRDAGVLPELPQDTAAEETSEPDPAQTSIASDEVEAAIVAAAEHPEGILDSLYQRFDQQALTPVLGEIFDYETIESHDLMKLTPDFESLDLATSRDRNCVLVSGQQEVTAIICDPFDQDLRPWLESRFPETLRWLLVSAGDMNAFIARHEQSMNAMDSAIEATGGHRDDEHDVENLSLASISQDSSPIVKLVHSTLYDALRAGASDIHMEAGNAALEIRYRIDGVLAHVATVSGKEVAEQVISRIKVMSELDIAERRIPQDGRFKSTYESRPIDFRVSIMPSSFGEDAVLRVLDKRAVTDQISELSLGSLGFADHLVDSLRKLSDRPYGMLLVTGPTGSGKTTTLYGAISETNSGLGKIVTIEDPVEYQLPGVLQIPVNEKKGLTFARGLRSILRHDPDKIMVGEIRDPETAQIAIQSALTGHLVFTTVHANNVFDVLSRFLHMGVDAYSFVSALNGILAQRLLRIVCRHCGEDEVPTQEMLKSTSEPVEIARTYKWRVGRGCSECRGTGYRGRRAVGELLILDDELREAIVDRAPIRELKEMAKAGGVTFIRTAALDLVRNGLTTIEEVNRVTTMA